MVSGNRLLVSGCAASQGTCSTFQLGLWAGLVWSGGLLGWWHLIAERQTSTDEALTSPCPQGVHTRLSTQAACSRTLELSAEDLSEDSGFALLIRINCYTSPSDPKWQLQGEGGVESGAVKEPQRLIWCKGQSGWWVWMCEFDLLWLLQLSGTCEGCHGDAGHYLMRRQLPLVSHALLRLRVAPLFGSISNLVVQGRVLLAGFF